MYIQFQVVQKSFSKLVWICSYTLSPTSWRLQTVGIERLENSLRLWKSPIQYIIYIIKSNSRTLLLFQPREQGTIFFKKSLSVCGSLIRFSADFMMLKQLIVWGCQVFYRNSNTSLLLPDYSLSWVETLSLPILTLTLATVERIF